MFSFSVMSCLELEVPRQQLPVRGPRQKELTTLSVAVFFIKSLTLGLSLVDPLCR